MSNPLPCRRYETLQGVEYEVQGSKGNWYTVPMIGVVAAGCQCRFSEFNTSCKHQTTAEQAEIVFLSQLNNTVETIEEKRLNAPLLRPDGFSLLKR